jgi:hypothetical protein
LPTVVLDLDSPFYKKIIIEIFIYTLTIELKSMPMSIIGIEEIKKNNKRFLE